MLKFLDKLFISFLFFLNKIYTFIITRLSGHFIVSIFINIYILLPLYNIYRALFLVYFNIYVFFFLILNTILLFSIFRKYEYIYTYILKLLFSDTLYRSKNIITLGTLFLKYYPFLFGVYLFISISCIFLVRVFSIDSSYIFIYSIYCACTIFRNMFIVPALGYALIINTNKKQCEYTNQGLFSMQLFKGSSLRYQGKFVQNVINWGFWFDDIKPPLKIVKNISYVSFGTSGLWYSLIIFKSWIDFNNSITNDLMDHIKDFIDDDISSLLTGDNKSSPEILYIITNIKKQVDSIYIEYNIYRDESLDNLSDYILHLLKKKRIEQLFKKFRKIRERAELLYYCEKLNKNDPDCKWYIEYLSQKYNN